MADIQQDLYGLTYSTSFQIQGTQEEAVNLTLPPAPSLLATVVGTVTDGTVPIPNATVKLFDSTGMPYQHTMTDAAGEYTLDGIPAGTYSIAAVAPDYLMSPAAGAPSPPATPLRSLSPAPPTPPWRWAPSPAP